MKEDFLQYLWQYQLFNTKQLFTTSGESVIIYKQGFTNTSAGPDFTDAKIQIGTQLWAGNVEIHLTSSDWYVHHHETDPAYDTVILHVVWEETVPVYRKNNTPISTLELKGLVPKILLSNYRKLFAGTKKWIACENSLDEIDTFTKKHFLERLYVERLTRKAREIEIVLRDTVNDWEAVLFRLLSKNFGLKVNGSSFEMLAQSIDFSIIRKEKNDPVRLEALLFGQAGLLDESREDAYFNELVQIYKFQQQKYTLTPRTKVHFFRLRPPNFPTIRLSQLAHLYSKYHQLFSQLMDVNSREDYYKILNVSAGSYWDTHYVFGKTSGKRTKATPEKFIDLVLINTLIPLKFTYQKTLGFTDIESLFQLIRQIPAENNSISNQFKNRGFTLESALESQALLTLKNDYCDPKACLHCELGMKILRKT